MFPRSQSRRFLLVVGAQSASRGPQRSKLITTTTTTNKAAVAATRRPRLSGSGGWFGASAAVAASTVAAYSLYNLSQRPPLALDSNPDSASEPLVVGTEQRRKYQGWEVRAHHQRGDCWVVIEGEVWDVTGFLESHPGGAELILEHGGKDISALFTSLHPPLTLTKVRSQLVPLGILDPTSVLEAVSLDGDGGIEERRAELPGAEYVLNLSEFEHLAKGVLGEEGRGWRYFSSAADDLVSYHSAASSFSYLRFLPRVNVPVAHIDSSTLLLSAHKVPIPIFFCPVGQNRQAHPEGELNMTRVGARTGFPQGVSSGASCSINEILEERDRLAEAGGLRTPVWWQLYIHKDREETAERVRNAVKAGSDAIIITVDCVTLGKREADARVLPRKGEKAAPKKDGGIASTTASLLDADLSWKDIDWVKSLAPGLPILIKGVQCPEDVELAKKHGAAGVIISNHGGRQLDGASPPIATLIRTREQYPQLLDDSKFDVYIDGGIRRGTDILKALCLGAKGVGLGRGLIYAQACYGEEGVMRACQILTEEVQTGMRLLGAKTIKDLRPEMLELLPGLKGERMK